MASIRVPNSYVSYPLGKHTIILRKDLQRDIQYRYCYQCGCSESAITKFGWEEKCHEAGSLNEQTEYRVRELLHPDVEAQQNAIPGASSWKESNPKDEAAANQGRVSLGLFPDTAVLAGALSMKEGREKYGQYNYRSVGVRASVYHEAARRHLAAWWNGEDIDPDSGLHHTWKALACLAVLIDAQALDLVTDDRPPRAPVGSLLVEHKETVRGIEERLKDYHPHQYTIKDSK